MQHHTVPRAIHGALPRPARGLSIVVPCFNEEEVLPELYRRLAAVCRAANLSNHEIVLVNDGSTDATWQGIRELCARDRHVVGVNLSRNHGHQLALSSGLAVAAGERVLVIDADLQDPPELLPAMMELMNLGADVVYGQRATRPGESWFKRVSAAMFYRLLDRLTDVRIPVDTGDFRLMDRRVVDHLNAMPENHRFLRGMISWLGFNQVPITYDRHERWAGTTKYPFRAMAKFAIDAITGFSIRPLRVAANLGALFGLVGVAALLYSMQSWLRGDVVPGWTSVMVAVLLLGSAQLFVMGIIGEYLGRLYIGSKQRPLFVIDQIVEGTTSTRVPFGAIASDALAS